MRQFAILFEDRFPAPGAHSTRLSSASMAANLNASSRDTRKALLP